MVYIFFGLGRKQLKLAVCRINRSSQRDTLAWFARISCHYALWLIRSRSMLGKTKKTTCEMFNLEKQNKSMLS